MQNGSVVWTPDVFTKGFVAQRVRELKEQGRGAGWDTADIRNELLMNMWHRQRRFNPRRGCWTTFVRLVTDHHVADLIARWWTLRMHWTSNEGRWSSMRARPSAAHCAAC